MSLKFGKTKCYAADHLTIFKTLNTIAYKYLQ